MKEDLVDELLPLVRLAAKLRVPEPWLRRQALEGRIPCLKIGKRLLCNPQAVRAALAQLAATSHCTLQEA